MKSFSNGGEFVDIGAKAYADYLNGDNEGLVIIVKTYSDSLVNFICKFVRDRQTAEDLMQDTFVELISKKNKFRNESQFKTYLFRIARNKAVDFIRKSSKTTFIFDETTVGDEDKLYVEDDICNAETKADLHSAIQALNPAYREIIYLSYFNNLSNEEIAIIIKKSKRQTELLLYRAKQSLKSALEKEGFIYG